MRALSNFVLNDHQLKLMDLENIPAWRPAKDNAPEGGGFYHRQDAFSGLKPPIRK